MAGSTPAMTVCASWHDHFLSHPTRLIVIRAALNLCKIWLDQRFDPPHMSSNAFFSDLLSSISERGRTLLRRVGSSEEKPDGAGLIALCGALLSGRGEASGTAMAREVLDRYHHLDDAERLGFFEALTRDFGPAPEKLA